MSFLLDTSVISELVKPSPDDTVAEWMKRADETTLYLSVLGTRDRLNDAEGGFCIDAIGFVSFAVRGG